MNRGFTLVEIVLMIVVLTILSAFTFSVIWQYSNLYAEVRQGSIYSEASAALERMTRELRDAGNVNTVPFVFPTYTAAYINFLPAHGTPATTPAPGGVFPPPQWVQYCTCTNAGGTSLYRVQNTTQGAANRCLSGCPTGSDTSLMSRNVTSSGFQIRYFQGNAGSTGPEGDSYEITLGLASGGPAGNPSITLVSRVSPRNYVPYNPDPPAAGTGSDRSFNGFYYDEIR